MGSTIDKLLEVGDTALSGATGGGTEGLLTAWKSGKSSPDVRPESEPHRYEMPSHLKGKYTSTEKAEKGWAKAKKKSDLKKKLGKFAGRALGGVKGKEGLPPAPQHIPEYIGTIAGVSTTAYSGGSPTAGLLKKRSKRAD